LLRLLLELEDGGDTFLRNIGRLEIYVVTIRNIIFFVVTALDLLTPWSCALFEKPPDAQLLKNSPTLYGNRRFITRARSIQSIPTHPIPLRSILLLFSPYM
jgi:hypothetical protein